MGSILFINRGTRGKMVNTCGVSSAVWKLRMENSIG